MIPVVGVYLGLVTALVGLATLIRPPGRLGLRKRIHGVVIGFCGLSLALGSALLPAPETRVSRPRTRLDEFVPRYQFREHHRLRVRGTAEDVYRAIHEVTASEIRFFQVLVWIRRGGRAGPESIV